MLLILLKSFPWTSARLSIIKISKTVGLKKADLAKTLPGEWMLIDCMVYETSKRSARALFWIFKILYYKKVHVSASFFTHGLK